MATKLTKGVERELTKVEFMGTPVIVEIVPGDMSDYLVFRLKGRKTGGRRLDLKRLYALSERSDFK